MKGKHERNGRIEMLRITATLCIAVYHFEWVYLGTARFLQHFYIWVEFFFVLSGFFLAKNAAKQNEIKNNTKAVSSIHYVWNELKKLYPLYLISFFFGFVVDHLSSDVTINSFIADLWTAKWEVVLGNIFMFDSVLKSYNVTSTYIASMLFVSLPLHYLISRNKEIYICCLAPLFVTIGYGRIITLYGNLSQWYSYDGYLTSSVIRALAGMSLGTLFYLVIVELLRYRRKTQIVLECICVISFFALVICKNAISFNDLIMWPFLFGGIISILYLNPLVNGKLNLAFTKIGRMAYPIFSFHYGVLLIMNKCIPGLGYRKGLPLFALALVVICVIVVTVRNVRESRSFLRIFHQNDCK